MDDKLDCLKPNKRHPSEFKEVRTLKGMTRQEQADFSYADKKRFFKVLLWDENHTCSGCGKEIAIFEQASLDHIVPKSRGGFTRLANVRLMHRNCNSKKGDKMPENFSAKAFAPSRSSLGAMEKQRDARLKALQAQTGDSNEKNTD